MALGMAWGSRSGEPRSGPPPGRPTGRSFPSTTRALCSEPARRARACGSWWRSGRACGSGRRPRSPRVTRRAADPSRRLGRPATRIRTLALEDYLVGVVSTENPGYWPQDALRAQAVASRTYALSHLRPGADFDLYPDDRSQNYHGLQKQFPSAAAAVVATRREVLFFDGRPIQAMFSASNGGVTSGPEDVWGGPPLPYLPTRPDPYDAQSPAGSWGPVKVSVDKLHAAFPGLPSTIAGVRLSRNSAERAATVTFVGIDGSTYSVGGRAFQQRLALRSTYLTVTPTY